MKPLFPPDAPWWIRPLHARRRPRLLTRAEITQSTRAHFAASGFVEVETAMLQVSPGNEAHVSALSTVMRGPDAIDHVLYLHTSPEFACKTLLAAGETRIFSLGKVFRDRERGALHHPEFTMLEWYRVGEPYDTLMNDCAAVLALAADAAGTSLCAWRGRKADPRAAPERIGVAEAFTRHAGFDLMATLGDVALLGARAAEAGVRTAPDDTWSDVFSRVLSQCVEPRLGIGRPTILDRYPLCEAALARPTPDDPRTAERFELYVCGVELANGFGELTDPVEQRRRFKVEMDERERIYGDRYPIDEDFLAALALMPQASGCALGFDRLVMLATGATHIDDVLWTPVARGPR